MRKCWIIIFLLLVIPIIAGYTAWHSFRSSALPHIEIVSENVEETTQGESGQKKAVTLRLVNDTGHDYYYQGFLHPEPAAHRYVDVPLYGWLCISDLGSLNLTQHLLPRGGSITFHHVPHLDPAIPWFIIGVSVTKSDGKAPAAAVPYATAERVLPSAFDKSVNWLKDHLRLPIQRRITPTVLPSGLVYSPPLPNQNHPEP